MNFAMEKYPQSGIRTHIARVAQIIERDGSNIEDEGEIPSASTNVWMVGRAVMPRSRKPSEPPGCVGAIPTPSAKFI